MLLNQALRYSPVVRLIESAPGSTLLDVGSGSRSVADLLSARWSVTAVDRDFGDYGAGKVGGADGRATYVQADAAALPFSDASFDVTLSLDMLEHVPPYLRGVVLAELARVSRRRLIVACPCGLAALEADRRLADFIRRRLRRATPEWLDEHLENGFPERAELREVLGKYGPVSLHANVSIQAHERLGRVENAPLVWLAATLAALAVRPGLGNDRGLAARVIRRLSGDDASPAYRTIAVLNKL